MGNYFTITLTTLRGSRQYELHRIVRPLAFWTVTGIALTLLLLIWSVKQLWEQGHESDMRQELLYNRLHKIATENSNLNDQLQLAQHGLNSIERHLDLDVGDGAPMQERVDRVSTKFDQMESEYSYVTQSVRSLENILGLRSDLIGRSVPSERKRRIDQAKLSAAHRRILFDNIPNDIPFSTRSILGDAGLEKLITSHYGYRIHPIKKKRQFHHGLDVGLAIGTPIIAPANGIVEDEGYSKGFGYYIALRHNFGFNTRYGHLQSRSHLRRGDVVTKGVEIGHVGNTGLSTGAHLHYEVYYLGRSLDPISFVQSRMTKTHNPLFNENSEIQWQPVIDSISDWLVLLEQSSSLTARN